MTNRPSDHAMIVAQYTDCRAFRSLGVVRITCELPVEYEAEVHRLIGYPQKGVIISVASEEAVKAFADQLKAPAREAPAPEKERKPRERKLSEKLDAKARSGLFQQFMRVEGWDVWSYEEAIAAQRQYLGVTSRSECDEPGSRAEDDARALLDNYEAFYREHTAEERARQQAKEYAR